MEEQIESMKNDSTVKCQTEENKTLKCEQCDFTAVHESYLKDHIKIHIYEENYSDLKLEVDKCNLLINKKTKTLERENKEVIHIKEETVDEKFVKNEEEFEESLPDSPDSEQPDIFDEDEELDIHSVKTEDMMEQKHSTDLDTVCNICLKNFSSKTDRARHIRFVHEKEKMFACGICNKRFSQEYGKKKHVRQVHENERKFECDVCIKKFSSVGSLTVHVRLHTGEKPFKCKDCGEGFRGNDYLRRHIENTHTNPNKQFTCNQCGLVLATPSGLSNHVITKHTDIKFACDLCGLELTTFGGLAKHRMNVHAFGQLFKCDICYRKFTTEVSLAKHKEKHKNQDFACSVCTKEFQNKFTLAIHMKTHSGIKDYQCNDCGKLFSSEVGQRLHVRTVHLGMRDFDCQTCGKSFTRRSALKVHNLTHTKETPFQCEYCDQGYKEKRNLTKHKERQHPDQ